MSDDLLAREQAAFERTERVLIDLLPDVTRVVDRAAAMGLDRAISEGLSRDVAAVAAQAVEKSVDVARDLFDASLTIASNSIATELAACEATLAARYAGLTAEIPARTTTNRRAWLDVMGEAYVAGAEEAARVLVDRTVDDWRAARASDEGAVDVLRRMVSTEQVRRPGHVGRGSWWRFYSGLTEALRSVEFDGVNGVREDAMRAFNAAYDERA